MKPAATAGTTCGGEGAFGLRGGLDTGGDANNAPRKGTCLVSDRFGSADLRTRWGARARRPPFFFGAVPLLGRAGARARARALLQGEASGSGSAKKNIGGLASATLDIWRVVQKKKMGRDQRSWE